MPGRHPSYNSPGMKKPSCSQYMSWWLSSQISLILDKCHRKVVPFGVWVSIYLVVDHMTISFIKSTIHRRALHHVDVIVRSNHSKESVQNSHVIICHRFKSHYTLQHELWIFPTKRAYNYFNPMHVVDPSKHTRKPPHFVLCQDPGFVFTLWCS
jgi:hypothetical protein